MITLADLNKLYARVAANDGSLVELNINFLRSDESRDESRVICRADDACVACVVLHDIMLALKKNTHVKTLRLDSSFLLWDSVAEMLRENQSVTRLTVGSCNMWSYHAFEVILTDLSMNRTVTDFTLEAMNISDIDANLGFALFLFLQRNKAIQSMTLDGVCINDHSIIESDHDVMALAAGLKSNTVLQRLVLQVSQRQLYASAFILVAFEEALQRNNTLVTLNIPYDNANEYDCRVMNNIRARLNSNKATKGCFNRVTATIGTLFTNTTTYLTEQVKSYVPGNR